MFLVGAIFYDPAKWMTFKLLITQPFSISTSVKRIEMSGCKGALETSVQGVMRSPELLPALRNRDQKSVGPGERKTEEDDLCSPIYGIHSFYQRHSMKWEKMRREQTQDLAKILLFQVLVDTLVSETPNVLDVLASARKKGTSAVKGLLFFMNSNFSHAAQRTLHSPYIVYALWFFSRPKSEDDKHLLTLLGE